MSDLFNNPNNDYVNPALSPCAGAVGDSNLEFVDDGIGIVSGSNILAKIDFSNIKIPVSAYSVETKVLGEQEITYIPGLAKGLTRRQEGFSMPNNLVSTDETLNSFFFEIDLSINYYDSFTYTTRNIDVSASYSENINIEDALNIAFGDLGIRITAGYDPSSLIFRGNMDGYEFNISNVLLSIIDASENASSPFPYLTNADEYLLEEDGSLNIPGAKYPNGATQGIVMKGIYPTTTPQTPYDKWLYINHVTDYVTVYEPIEISNFISDVSSYLGVSFDPSTIIGCGIIEPSLGLDFNIKDSSAEIYDISVGPIGITDVSGLSIDGSIIREANLLTCYVTTSDVSLSYILDGTYEDSSIYESLLETPALLEGYLQDSILLGDPSLNLILDAITILDSSISNVIVDGALINGSYLRDSSINSIDPSSNYNIIDSTSVGDTSLLYTDILSSSLSSTWVYDSYANRSALNSIKAWDSSINKSVINDSSIFGVSYLEDVSIYSSGADSVLIDTGEIGQSTISNSVLSATLFGECSIGDSSIIEGSIINNASVISNSIIENSWTNTYRLLVGTDPSGNKIYEYVMNDDTLNIDTSLATIIISDTEIWDSSINNAVINDCSIFRSYLEDVSLNRCTIYNSPLDPSYYTSSLDTNRIILIDPSISNMVDLTYDTSTFYTKSKKKLEVGMNGCSTEDSMSAGDYLQWATTNDYWNKFGELYIWSSAPDCDECGYMKNLIDGFYVYNPHSFDIKIEYMLFI